MKLNLKFVSLVLGILVWIYANLIVSPVLRRTVTGPIEIANVPDSTQVTSPEQTADVTLNGTRREFIIAGTQPIKLFVDLYDRRPGKLLVPVRYQPPTGITVVSVHPTQVEVTLQTLKRAKFQVEAEVAGQPAEGFIAETPRIRPEIVEVEGPEELMRSIVKCRVVLNLSDLRHSISEGKPVRVVTEYGEIDKLSVFPDKVNVDVAVKEGYPEKIVPIATPTFLNKPPEGLRLTGFSIDPPTITISAPQRVLTTIKDLRLRQNQIDLAAIQSGSTVLTTLTQPFDSVKILGSPTVRVSFALAPAAVVRQFAGLPLTIKKSPEQYCRTSVSSYSMVLEGHTEDLNACEYDALEIVLDVSGMSPGHHLYTLKAPTTLPKNIIVQDIRPAEIEFELSELSENAGDTTAQTQQKPSEP